MTSKELTGKRIQERRKAMGYTQTQLAKKMGYSSRSGINRIESGVNNVSAAKLKLFADVLNTTVDYLIGNTNNSEKVFSESVLSIHNKLDKYDSESKIGRLIYSLILYGNNYSNEDIDALNKYVEAINYKNKLKNQE